MIQLPLLELFETMRVAGVELGIDDYFLAVDALRGGFGAESVSALRKMLRALWIKREDDKRLFEHQFDAWVEAARVAFDAEVALAAAERDQEEDGNTFPAIDDEAEDAPPSSSMMRVIPPLEERDEEDESISSISPVVEIEDPTRKAEAVERILIREDAVAERGSWRRSNVAYPLTDRQMQQNWRGLRRAVREGPAIELDVDATVHQLARDMLMLDPVMRPRRVNRSSVVLLIDYGGSMIPFHYLARRLISTAQRGGRLASFELYYFQNWPRHNLFRDPYRAEPVPVAQWLQGLNLSRDNVIFFSDAGAARGHLRPQRIKQTEQLLRQLRQQVRSVAWLNPVPAERWQKTTADRLSRVVPMFPLSRRGMQHAIQLLQGRPVDHYGSKG